MTDRGEFAPVENPLPVVAGLHYAVPGVDQTSFADSLAGGNCLQACVATILNEPIELVPHFYLFGAAWLRALDLFMNLWSLTVERDSDASGLTIAVGMSPRGVKHCVLCVNGEMVHDPHPSRAGLESVDYHLGVWGDVFQRMETARCTT